MIFIKKLSLFFKKICMVIGFITILFIFLFSLSIAFYFKSLPDLQKLQFSDLKKLAETKAKEEMSYGAPKEKYKWTQLDEISKEFLYAIIFTEDSTFYRHSGINFDAMLDSLGENIKRRSYAFGASTITQQVVKNLFLTKEKKLTRKVSELIVAYMLDKYFTKNQILEIYINIAEFGPDIYGVKMASDVYFKKLPSDINAGEGAFIAMMLPSPKRYYKSIFLKKVLASKRRQQLYRVLRDMVELNYISQEQFDEYVNFNFLKKLDFIVQ